jgi:dynein heavy chain
MYVRQSLDILDGLIDVDKIPSAAVLSRYFVFALMWSLGALLELYDRKKFEEFLIQKNTLNLPKLHGDETIFEFVVSEAGEWEHWNNRVPNYLYPKDSLPEYAGILVPNVDNVRADFLINILAKQEKAILLIGEQGTAKTVIIKGFCNKYDADSHLFKSFNFSSASIPYMFQVGSLLTRSSLSSGILNASFLFCSVLLKVT